MPISFTIFLLFVTPRSWFISVQGADFVSAMTPISPHDPSYHMTHVCLQVDQSTSGQSSSSTDSDQSHVTSTDVNNVAERTISDVISQEAPPSDTVQINPSSADERNVTHMSAQADALASGQDWRVTVMLKLLSNLRQRINNNTVHAVIECKLPGLLDRIELMLCTVMSRNRSDSAADSQTHLQRWLEIAATLSRRHRQPLRELSLVMVMYGVRIFMADRTVSVTDLGSVFHQLLTYAFPSNIYKELLIIARNMTSIDCSVRNEQNETPLQAALRVIPEANCILSLLIQKTSSEDLATAMGPVLDLIDASCWARMFEKPIDERLAALDYRLDVFLDELGLCHEDDRRQKAEAALRIRHVFFRGAFLPTFTYLFFSMIASVSHHDQPMNAEEFPEALGCMLESGQRDLFLQSVTWIRAGHVTSADVLRQCIFPEEVPDLLLFIRLFVQCVSQSTQDQALERGRAMISDMLAQILDLALKYCPDFDACKVLDQSTVVFMAPLILHRTMPDADLDAAGVYDRIAQEALNSDVEECYRANLLRVGLYMIRGHYASTDRVADWAGTFSGDAVLGVREIWPDLIRIVTEMLTTPCSQQPHVTEAGIRVLAAFISHPATRDDMTRYGRVPASATQFLVRDLLASLPADVLVRVFLSIEDDPMLHRMFRMRWPRGALRLALAFIAEKHSVWFRTSVLRSATVEEVMALTDVCSICLNAHIVAVDDHVPDHVTFRTPCGHYFHGNCVMHWLASSLYCPMCRTSLYDLNDAVSFVRRRSRSAA